MDRLEVIARKDPITSTFSSAALSTDPREVRGVYDWHAATYVEPPPLAQLCTAFVDAVKAGATPKACLVAPFGYGKTASAIGIWGACQKAGLLAVPPVSVSSFVDLAGAVFDWLLYLLPERADTITSIHDQFLANSAESLARRDEREFGIEFERAMAAISDKLERGYLDFEDVSINLVAFLTEASHIAREAGYSGLVVIVDEMQQLLGNANKGVLVALRQLVWGLRTRKLPLGLMLTMDSDTERTLADRAGDILHRIKDDGLYLDIRGVYDRDFPAQLWSQYVAALELSPEESASIDRPTLEALGQLCEREDLSNGPRTVINVLQLAASRAAAGGCRPYTPIDLVSDLISGAVKFDGDRGMLPALVAELENYPYFQRSPSRTAALRLVAAFPRGCPKEIALVYGLEDAWNQLGDELRGEVVTELDEGLALIELQRVARPANRLNVLLRRYWMQITDQQLFGEDAAQAFTQFVLPLMFPSKVHDLSGWEGLDAVLLTSSGAYSGVIEGTSSPRFPLRRIGITVTGDQELRPNPQHTDIDLSLLIRIDLSPDAVTKLCVTPDEGMVELSVALAHSSAEGLQGGLSWIEHYLSPHAVSAAVVLSLLRYFHRHADDRATARDHERIQDTVGRLRDWLLVEVLDESLFHSAGFEVLQGGVSGFQEFLFILCQRRWPTYTALATHQHWEGLFGHYIRALEQSPPSTRAGAVARSGTKAELAGLFGLKRHAGFPSHIRQYGDLLAIEGWQGDEGAIRFNVHPQELRLANALREHGPRSLVDAQRDLRAEGFAAPEVLILLKLAGARGLVKVEDNLVFAPASPAPAELLSRVSSMEERLAALSDAPTSLADRIANAQGGLADGEDTALLEWELMGIDQELASAEEAAALRHATALNKFRQELMASLSKLSPIDAAPEHGGIANHLNGMYGYLERERSALRQTLDQALTVSGEQALEAATSILPECDKWVGKARLYQRWCDLLHRVNRLDDSLLRLDSEELSSLSGRLSSLLQRARSVLAEQGLPALGTIALLEPILTDIERDFTAAADLRSRVYSHVAVRLQEEAAEVIGHADLPSVPAYDPEKDELSFARLSASVCLWMSRTVALYAVELPTAGTTRNEALRRAKLRADIRDLARRARNPDWTLRGPSPGVNPDAARAIRRIRERVQREIDTGLNLPTDAHGQLIGLLSAIGDAGIELADLLRRVSKVADESQLLAALLRLEEAGTIRIHVELDPDDGSRNLTSDEANSQ